MSRGVHPHIRARCEQGKGVFIRLVYKNIIKNKNVGPGQYTHLKQILFNLPAQFPVQSVVYLRNGVGGFCPPPRPIHISWFVVYVEIAAVEPGAAEGQEKTQIN
jgi:hypothetical protein